VTPRGGFVAVWPVAVLQGDSFADLTLAQLGAWLRLRCAQEMLNEPFSRKAARRLGVSESIISILLGARLLDDLGDGLLTIHDIEDSRPHRKPSDAPEATRQRQTEYRARHPAAVPTPATRDNALARDVTPLPRDLGVEWSDSRVDLSEGVQGEPGPSDDPADLDGAGIYYEVTTRYPSKTTTKDWANQLERDHGPDAFRRVLADEHRADSNTSTLLGRAQSRLAMQADRATAERQTAAATRKAASQAAEKARQNALKAVPAKAWPPLADILARNSADIIAAETAQIATVQ
jgi:hypothetical protein